MEWKELYKQEGYNFKRTWNKANNWQKSDFVEGVTAMVIGIVMIVVAVLV